MLLPVYLHGSLSFSFLAAFLSFTAYQQAHGNQEVLKAYLACVEHKNTGLVQSTQAECVGRLAAYIVNVLAAILGGGYAAGTAEARLKEPLQVKGIGKVEGEGMRDKLTALVSLLLVPGVVIICARYGASKVTRVWVAASARLMG